MAVDSKLIAPHLDTRGIFVKDLTESDDQRRFLSMGEKVDDRAIFSVLQFGAIVPPLSIAQGVRRVIPGANALLPIVTYPDDPDEQANAIETIVDEALRDIECPIILFSGGIDSGLIAARAKALAKHNAILVNFSFGSEDPESHLAEAMARHLGLQFERITSDESPTFCLEAPGAIYPNPFADTSTVPSSALARAVVRRFGAGATIIDGTGADGGFGMVGKISKWKRAMRIPALVRKIGGAGFGLTWLRNGKEEYYSHLFRRAATMPFLSAVLAQNALGGILYDNSHAPVVHSMLEDWGKVLAGQTLARQVVAIDLAMTCANTFAQKAQSIYRQAGADVVYPFLTPRAFAVGLAASGSQMREAKAPLKRALARLVPPAMVYRPKSGFVDPQASVFFTSDFKNYLQESHRGPLAGAVRPVEIQRALKRLNAGDRLAPQTLSALWAVVFLDRWLRTIPSSTHK